jgi:hypothetical protein
VDLSRLLACELRPGSVAGLTGEVVHEDRVGAVA